MASVLDRTCIVEDKKENDEEADRISNLPDDVIQHILGFLDMKYAVQTSVLSPKWVNIWKSTRHLNLNSCLFTQPLFANFVEQALHQRNCVEVSKVHLTFTGPGTPLVVEAIVNYAYHYNVSEVNFEWLTSRFYQFPKSLFCSHTLKHLTLATSDQAFYEYRTSCVPKVSWNFPALETLRLSGLHFGDYGDHSLDLFSKCVNLRDLTLHTCCMFGLRVFKITAPELSNLTIIDANSYPNFLDVDAPKLKNFTAPITAAIPQYPSYFDCLQFSTEAFDSLEKVDLSLSLTQEQKNRFSPYPLHVYWMRYFPMLRCLFRKFHTTKFLVLCWEIIQVLGVWSNELPHEQSCPLENLEWVKINTMSLDNPKDLINQIPTEVRNYLLRNSPNATIVMV